MENSNLWKLNWKDLLNGLITAVLGSVIFYMLAIFTSIYEKVMSGTPFSLGIDWRSIMVVAIFSALTYLSKRFVSNSSGTTLGIK